MTKALFTSREAIDTLLANNPRPLQLQCRAGAVQRLAEDCARFFPWPALHASLMADVAQITRRVKKTSLIRS